MHYDFALSMDSVVDVIGCACDNERPLLLRLDPAIVCSVDMHPESLIGQLLRNER